MEKINPSTLRSRRRRARMTANQRTRERAHYARSRRIDLIVELAPDLECAECGERVVNPAELEVDHVNGRLWRVEDMSPSMRSARYWREYEAGEPMRALCRSCNGSLGSRFRGTYGGRR